MSEPTHLPRPTVLTRDVQALIVEAVGRGNYITTACEMAGIDYGTFLYWRKKCEADAPEAKAFADFFISIKKALAIGEANALVDLKTGSPGWQAQAWFLERRFPKRWGKQDRATPEPEAPSRPRILIPGADVRHRQDDPGGDPAQDGP